METLKAVRCPSIILHAAHPSNMQGYYDGSGVLLGAMDDRDASRVHSLLSRGTLVDNVKSGHDIHSEQPEVLSRLSMIFVDLVEGVGWECFLRI